MFLPGLSFINSLEPGFILRLCGGQQKVEMTDEERAAIEEAREKYDPIAAIQEDKRWNLYANICAVITVEVCVFLYAYFA